jgi:hypothetical protein
MTYIPGTNGSEVLKGTAHQDYIQSVETMR